MGTRAKTPRLLGVPLSQVVRLADGRKVMVVGPTKHEGKGAKFRWVREYLGEEEWAPGKWSEKLAELEPAEDQEVAYVERDEWKK